VYLLSYHDLKIEHFAGFKRDEHFCLDSYHAIVTKTREILHGAILQKATTLSFLIACPCARTVLEVHIRQLEVRRLLTNYKLQTKKIVFAEADSVTPTIFRKDFSEMSLIVEREESALLR
jgi:hypothetical protein